MKPPPFMVSLRVSVAARAFATDWPISTELAPSKWIIALDQNIAWKITLPETGQISPSRIRSPLKSSFLGVNTGLAVRCDERSDSFSVIPASPSIPPSKKRCILCLTEKPVFPAGENLEY